MLVEVNWKVQGWLRHDRSCDSLEVPTHVSLLPLLRALFLCAFLEAQAYSLMTSKPAVKEFLNCSNSNKSHGMGLDQIH